MKKNVLCTVCNESCSLLDVVDFNKSCEEASGKFFNLSGIPIYYALCNYCGFCFAPDIVQWKLETFEEMIYNDEYVLVDPEYMEHRPRANAQTLISMFKDRAHSIKHLDYGGGSGFLSSLLVESHWQSISYDPFVDKHKDMAELEKADLITAFEVFEHVPDPKQMMSTLCSLLAPGGMILFSTLLSDNYIAPNERLSWWYASPRNGHISLFSKNSLTHLASEYSLHFASFSNKLHLFFTTVPAWADTIIIQTD
jgi:SAM-dependent methyltransferase